MNRHILLSTVAITVLAGCSPIPTSSEPTAENTLSVAASFYPLAFLAEEIGAERVSVRQITPAGVEPHDYDPAPQQIAAIYDADVFLFNGGGLDPWAEKIHGQLEDRSVVTVEMMEHFTLLQSGDEDEDEHEDDEHSHEEGAFDPHIWLDPMHMKKEAELIRDAFIAADPFSADTYRSNADTLITKLELLNASFKNGLAQCALQEIIVSHNAFAYLSDRYGFETIALSGLSPMEEPSAQKMAEIAEIAREKNIGYIFFETLASPKLSETIASEIGAQSLVLNPIEGLTADDEATGKTYLSLMEKNLQNLRIAMQCQ